MPSSPNDLATAYIPLARSLVARMAEALRGKGDPDELESDAMLGLVQASREFDARIGVSFATYAKQSIWCRMLDGIRKKNKGWLKYGVETVSLESLTLCQGHRDVASTASQIGDSAHAYRLGMVEAGQRKRSRKAKTLTFKDYKVKITKRTKRKARKAA